MTPVLCKRAPPAANNLNPQQAEDVHRRCEQTMFIIKICDNMQANRETVNLKELIQTIQI